MKIVSKLTIALVAGTCLILGVNGYLRVRREVATFETDRLRDREMIGQSLAAAVSATWKLEGEAPALASVEAVDRHFTKIHIRWVSLESRDWREAVPSEAPAGLRIRQASRDVRGERTWLTYAPVEVDGTTRGAIELAESAAIERAMVSAVVRDSAVAALVLTFFSALVAFVLGNWLVGRPVRALAAKARRIGNGDFSEPIHMQQDDELKDLAIEMNAMCERLTSTLEQLRHADRLATVGKLASGVAHELGTPLNVVSARAAMIASGDTNLNESREYARVVASAAERMTKIVRQLLQFARRKGADKVPCNLHGLIEETLQLLRPLAQKRAVDLVLEPTTIDPTVPVDASQFQQVVTNLVMNAVHATPEGGRVVLALEIACMASPTLVRRPGDSLAGHAEQVCLRVKDAGVGIPPEVLGQIFEPFFTTKDVGEGTGLGLAVSHGIVRDHGGWISVESKVGQGSTFSVFLARTATAEPDQLSLESAS